MKRSGKFIAFDGPNGVGKSTLISEVADRLRRRGFRVHLTKEVTNTKLGKFIREVHKEYCGLTLALLVAADRQNHIEQDILPALETHDFVITDRYVASSLVFQKLDGVKQSLIWRLNENFLKPHITMIITASAKIIAARLATRTSHDRFEQTFQRRQEVQLFTSAATFLRQKGFPVKIFKNESTTIAAAAEQLALQLSRGKLPRFPEQTISH